MKKPLIFLFLFYLLSSIPSCYAQEERIHWLSFEQLEDSLDIAPRKVFVNFYADWCAYCKKMDRAAFKDSGVVSLLNTEYLAVKMNAEATDTIVFGGKTYVNKELGRKRNPKHEIPLLLASRENRPFSLPAMIVLDENFEITGRYFEYLSPEEVAEILKK